MQTLMKHFCCLRTEMKCDDTSHTELSHQHENISNTTEIRELHAGLGGGAHVGFCLFFRLWIFLFVVVFYSFQDNIKIMAESTFSFSSQNPPGLYGDLKSKTFTLEQ